MKSIRRSVKQKVMAVVFAVLCLVVLMSAYLFLLNNEISLERERCRYITENEAAHIVTTIDCVMARTSTLIALVQDHNGDTSFFENVADDVVSAVKEETGVTLKNIAIAPTGLVTNVYPLEGNENLIGFDFLDLSRPGNKEAIKAYEQGKTILTNPFEMVQGGLGISGRAPVILRSASGSRFWGLVCVTIDFDKLIDELKLKELRAIGLEYTLSYLDEDGALQLILSGGVPGKDASTTRFEIRNLTWELTASPASGWIPTWRIAAFVLVIVVVSCFAGVFANNVFKLRTTNEMLKKLSNTDRLTGCMNRRAYEDELAKITIRTAADDFVCVSADVNGLKRANDTLGHLSGDELLCGAADCLNKCFGTHGTVYRIGGDEFACLINADEKTLAGLNEKFVKESAEWKGHSVSELSVSVGCAARREFPEAPVSALVKTADERMYAAKSEYYRQKGIDRRKT
ncbi:MAG: sensor domain-containing diguanylate cyclase [Clostridia bacterium]|nr:sensor domain-containing diguanylate cyclase [Clostridia bacterium]